MGDTGSNLLGYLLATIAIQGALKTNAVVALFFPLIVLAVPILDTGFVVAKRIKYRPPIYRADRWHFHHRMANIGFSQRRTLAYLYGWVLVMAGLALALRFVPYSDDHGNFDLVWTLVIARLLRRRPGGELLPRATRWRSSSCAAPGCAVWPAPGRLLTEAEVDAGRRPRARDGQLRGGQPGDRRVPRRSTRRPGSSRRPQPGA